MGLITGSGSSPGIGDGNPLQYSCLENSMDRGVGEEPGDGIAKSQTWLSDWAHTEAQSLKQCGMCPEIDKYGNGTN